MYAKRTYYSKNLEMLGRNMVAGPGFAPRPPDYEPGEVLFLHPATRDINKKHLKYQFKPQPNV